MFKELALNLVPIFSLYAELIPNSKNVKNKLQSQSQSQSLAKGPFINDVMQI